MEQFVVFRGIKLQGITLGGKPIVSPPESEIPGVMVETPTIDTVEEKPALLRGFREEATRPIEVVDIGARRNELQIDSKTWDCRREAPVFSSVLLRSKVPAASPGLVADSPKAHLVRIAIASWSICAHVSPGRGSRR